jgi:hypothetical protein
LLIIIVREKRYSRVYLLLISDNRRTHTLNNIQLYCIKQCTVIL